MAQFTDYTMKVLGSETFYIVSSTNQRIFDAAFGKELTLLVDGKSIKAVDANSGEWVFTTSDLKTEEFYGHDRYVIEDNGTPEYREITFETRNSVYSFVNHKLEDIHAVPAKQGYKRLYKIITVDDRGETPYNVAEHHEDLLEARKRLTYLKANYVDIKGVFAVYLENAWCDRVAEAAKHLPGGEFNFSGRRDYRKRCREEFAPAYLKEQNKREYFNRLDYVKDMI